jgi:hypothetical protein
MRSDSDLRSCPSALSLKTKRRRLQIAKQHIELLMTRMACGYWVAYRTGSSGVFFWQVRKLQGESRRPPPDIRAALRRWINIRWGYYVLLEGRL